MSIEELVGRPNVFSGSRQVEINHGGHDSGFILSYALHKHFGELSPENLLKFQVHISRHLIDKVGEAMNDFRRYCGVEELKQSDIDAMLKKMK